MPNLDVGYKFILLLREVWFVNCKSNPSFGIRTIINLSHRQSIGVQSEPTLSSTVYPTLNYSVSFKIDAHFLGAGTHIYDILLVTGHVGLYVTWEKHKITLISIKLPCKSPAL